MESTSIKICGTISRRSYESIGKYMLSFKFIVLFVAVVVLLDAALLLIAWLFKDWAWMILALTLSLSALAFFRWNRKNVVASAIASTPGIREGKSFDLDISFDDDAIRVHNRATELDTALSYELFYSYVETEDCLALFVKTGTFLLVPTTNTNNETKKQILALLKNKCSTMFKRKI